MNARSRRTWLAVAALVAALAPAAAKADDDGQKRADLMAQLNGLVDNLTSRVGGGDVDGALSIDDQIKSKLDELDAVKGDDSTAADMVSRWRDAAGRFPDAANALKQVLAGKDKYQAFDATCQSQDAALRAQLKKYVDDRNTAGLTEIPPLVESALAPIKSTFDEAEAASQQQSDARGRASGFDGDGPWHAVGEKLRDAAQSAGAVWEKNRADYTRSCTPLLSPKDHPAVVETLKFLGDLKQTRDALIDKLKQEVRQVAQDVAGAPSQSDDGVLAATEGKANAIQSDVAALDPMKGTDADSNQIVSRWPQFLKSYLDAEAALRQLKQYQHTLDSGPDKCRSAASQLQSAIASALQNKDNPKAAADGLVAQAKSLGAPLADSLAKADGSRDAVQKLRDTAKAFAADDAAWKEVDDAFSVAADAIDKYWEDELAQSHSACDTLARSENNPDVVSAVATLTATGQDAMKNFSSMSDQWLSDARECYRLDCDDMKQMWDAFCGDDWEPGDDPNKDGGRDLAEQLKSGIRDKMDPILSRYDGVVAAGQTPLNNPDNKDEVQKRLDALKDGRDKMQRIRDGGAFRGADNPLVQYAIEYGKQQHASMTSSYSCDVHDVDFGGEGRPDCIVFSSCKIYEFKPNNDRAIRKGNDQLEGYLDQVKNYYQKLIDNNDTADSDHGGSDALQKLSGCISDGKIDFSTEVKTYDMCENKYECVQP